MGDNAIWILFGSRTGPAFRPDDRYDLCGTDSAVYIPHRVFVHLLSVHRSHPLSRTVLVSAAAVRSVLGVGAEPRKQAVLFFSSDYGKIVLV